MAIVLLAECRRRLENLAPRPMQEYRSNKLKTAADIVARIDNWPTAFAMRFNRQKPGLQLLRFRDGLNVICRGATRDWDVVHELLFAGSYARAMAHLKGQTGEPVVLDLGGNIGLFSLLAARSNPQARIFAFEPGPPNFRLFEMNRLANPELTERIKLSKEAVAGETHSVEWFFDESNPGGSGLFATEGKKFTVQLRAFAEVVPSLPGPVALAKIDIEGAEFELLAATPPQVWQQISAVSLELHEDPSGKFTQTAFLDRMKSFGFMIEEESVCTFFLHR
jgi:FkbM family methyltransferase